MRLKGAWSMSTVGLTAQEISFPIENPFLRGSYCHSMAGSKSSWSARHFLHNFYFSMATPTSDHSYQAQQKGPPLSYERDKHSPGSQRSLPKKPWPVEASTTSPTDRDKVVPSLKKLSFQGGSSPPQTPSRCSKPLPPIPPCTDISYEQAMDSEVEYFTSSDDSRCLVSNHCSKSFSRNHVNRRSIRDYGQINLAYYEGPVGPQSPQHPQQHHQASPPQEQSEQQKQPEACHRLQDKAQRKLRRSLSGPPGSLHKPSQLRSMCQKRLPSGSDKPEVPPPVPPRTLKTGDLRRWSAEVSSGAYSDEDKPPKVPPRGPLSRGNSRTPSPKSLPSYSNGVMPATQSFAPNPNYVSFRSLQRQNSEGSPRILPIMENGRKVSGTHYYLLPSEDSPCDWHQNESAGGSCLKGL